MELFLQDIRYAIRNLRSHLTFAGVAILTIALGIGANTAIFSVVNAVLLRDLPFEQPDRLARVWSTNAERGIERGFMSPPDIADYQSANRTFASIAAYSEAELAMIDRDGSAIKVTGTWAGDNLFSVLGVGALLGRTFTPEDGVSGAEKVMVLGHGFWRSRFGGDPSVIGTSITVEDAGYTVVGVMPDGFDFPGRSSFWLNRYLLSYPGRYARWMDVVGRLEPEVDFATAQADLAGIATRLEAEYPNWNRAYGVTTVPLHDAIVGETRSALLILLGATGLLLLVACANVINLLLSRMADRGREIAVRVALGAGRLRIGRQILTECLVLAVAGAALGTVLAAVGIDMLVAVGPANLPRLDEVRLDGTVFLFTMGTTVFTGIVFGLAPSLRLAAADIQATLQDASKGSTSGTGRERVRGFLVISEIAGLVGADRQTPTRGPDQVDLHVHGHGPGQTLADPKQQVRAQDPAPTRRPDQDERHRQGDQPAGHQHPAACRPGRELPGPKVADGLRDAEARHEGSHQQAGGDAEFQLGE